MLTKNVYGKVARFLFSSAGCAVFASLAFPPKAGAAVKSSAEGDHFYQGEELDMQLPCVSVSAETDPAVEKGIKIQGILPKSVNVTVAKDEAQSRILIRSENKAETCTPVTRLSIRIPANFSLVLHDSPKTALQVKGRVESFEGSLVAGDSVHFDQLDSLDLKMSGDSKAFVENLNRAAQLVASEKASFSSQKADLSALSVFVSGQADFLVRSGHINTAHFTISDEAQAQIFASVGHADIKTKDSGFVRLGTVSEAPELTDGSVLKQETSPAGTVVISQPDVVVPPPPEDAVPQPATLPAGVPAEGVKPPAQAVKSSPASAVQPSVTGGVSENPAQGEEDTLPAPGTVVPPAGQVPATATAPVSQTPISAQGTAVSTPEAVKVPEKAEHLEQKTESEAARKAQEPAPHTKRDDIVLNSLSGYSPYKAVA